MNNLNTYNKTQKRANTTKIVQLNNIVIFELFDHETKDTDTYTYKIVNHPKSNNDELSLYSPLGQYILNKHIADKITYSVNHKDFTITILDVKTQT